MKYLFVFMLVGLMVSCGVNKKSLAKQPNCDEIEGFQTDDLDLVPEDYTGVVFKCIDGKVQWLRNYKDGKNDGDGLQRVWHKNGQLGQEFNYKDGKEVGLFRSWYENGQLKYEGNFKDGKEDGLFREWYENGQLKSIWNWKEGKLDGLTRDWYRNGQLEYEANFKDGELISKKCWDEDGNEINCGW
jgi:antitoxin component YwqK of YwqJK toxin-antitoxin module